MNIEVSLKDLQQNGLKKSLGKVGVHKSTGMYEAACRSCFKKTTVSLDDFIFIDQDTVSIWLKKRIQGGSLWKNDSNTGFLCPDCQKALCPQEPNELFLSPKGLETLRWLEGMRFKMYNDPAGNCTIGYGHLIHYRGHAILDNERLERPFKGGITEEVAEALLTVDVFCKAESVIKQSVVRKLTQNQFDALCVFVFNIGSMAFKSSTFLKVLNADSIDEKELFNQWRRWVHAGGKVVNGLKSRRESEIMLWKGEL